MGISTFSQQTVNTGFSSPAGSGNVIINGAFDIWQRGTSGTGSSGTAFTADRWSQFRGGGATGITVSRQASGLNGFQYSARVQRSFGNSSNTVFYFVQNLESATSLPLAGSSVTLSFYARAGANYSAADSILRATIESRNGTEAAYWTVGDGVGTTIQATNNATLTNSWQRFTLTANVPSDATHIFPAFRFNPTGTASTNDWFEVTGVQLEAGAVATPFRRNAPSIQAELAACQRYYEKSYPQEVAPGTSDANGPTFYGSTDSFANIVVRVPLSVRKRNSSYTLTMYLFEGDSGQVFYARNGATGNVIPQPYRFNENSFHAYAPTGAAWVVAQTAFHWTVSNEL
jgi:hypothetical protein